MELVGGLTGQLRWLCGLEYGQAVRLGLVVGMETNSGRRFVSNSHTFVLALFLFEFDRETDDLRCEQRNSHQ